MAKRADPDYYEAPGWAEIVGQVAPRRVSTYEYATEWKDLDHLGNDRLWQQCIDEMLAYMGERGWELVQAYMEQPADAIRPVSAFLIWKREKGTMYLEEEVTK